MHWTTSPPVPVLARPERVARATSRSEDLARLRQALDAIPNCGTAELDYDRWRNVVFGIHHETQGSDEGLELAHEFSARAAKYDSAFLDNRVWPYIREERDGPTITAEAVYALAREQGWEDPDFYDGFPVQDENDSSHGENDPEVVPHAPSQRFEFVRAVDFHATKPLPWLIKGVLPLGCVGMVFGASGAGKSFVTLDFCMAIARGIEWRGRRVHRARILYVVAEGASGFRKRLQAYALENGVDLEDIDLYVLPAAPNFTSKEAVAALIRAAKAAGPCGLIVVDTLARVAVGADENSAADMGVLVSNAEVLANATGATVLVVHHSGKDAAKGARGSSALRGAMDVELEVTRADADRLLTVSKMRDGEDGATFGFRLKTVELGEDEDGEAVTSCVVAYSDVPAAGPRPRLGRTKQLVMDQVRDLIGLDGGLPTPEAVIEACVPMIASEPRVARQNAKRALNSLVEDGLVTVSEGRLSVAGRHAEGLE